MKGEFAPPGSTSSVGGSAGPPATAGANQWEWQTHTYDRLHVRLALILEEILAHDPTVMLELGCGVGVLKKEILRRAPHVRYFGCDVSRSAVALANDPRVVCADLNHGPIPFEPVRFDLVAGSGILEYVHDAPALLRSIRSRLVEGGGLIISYFNMGQVYRRAQALLRRPPYRHPAWVNDLGHDELRELLRGCGFRIQDEIPTSLGIGPSPPIGRERWGPRALRRMRRLPFVEFFAHQVVFVCKA